jgi:hypothetical protein
MDDREIGLESVNWVHLAPDWDWCWVLVNVVTNFVSMRGRAFLWQLRI